ncbi:MAG: glutathione S-transferase N-terminal domain-containing protein [Pseudomonadota bacterium]
MIDLYTWTTPNGRKASVMLEEVGLPYEVHPVNIGADEQFKPDFLAISPNNKIPAIVDRDTRTSVFESGAILIYLAETSGQLLPTDAAARAKTLEWLMWQMASWGPMLGQLNHFMRAAPEPVPYAVKRFTDEAVRLIGVLDKRLGQVEFVAGDYSIADVAIYTWAAVAMDPLKQAAGVEAPNIDRWLAAVGARPAVQKGMAVPAV